MSENNRPVLDAVTFVGAGEGKRKGLKIGAAWETAGSAVGFNIVLDALPINGRFSLLERRSKKEDDTVADDVDADYIDPKDNPF